MRGTAFASSAALPTETETARGALFAPFNPAPDPVADVWHGQPIAAPDPVVSPSPDDGKASVVTVYVVTHQQSQVASPLCALLILERRRQPKHHAWSVGGSLLDDLERWGRGSRCTV